jgi:hypothetical protein
MPDVGLAASRLAPQAPLGSAFRDERGMESVSAD